MVFLPKTLCRNLKVKVLKRDPPREEGSLHQALLPPCRLPCALLPDSGGPNASPSVSSAAGRDYNCQEIPLRQGKNRLIRDMQSAKQHRAVILPQFPHQTCYFVHMKASS